MAQLTSRFRPISVIIESVPVLKGQAKVQKSHDPVDDDRWPQYPPEITMIFEKTLI
jgi:hypothetical protein